ncbi:hypothetical protein V8F20_008588 [Naviculisporaceae sp. PSN 640]
MVYLNKSWLLAATLAFAARSVLAAARKATDLFIVDFSTDDNGGCAYMGENEIDTQLQEAFEILSVGVVLVGDYGNVDEAERLLKAFFKPEPSSADLSTLSSNYERVIDFLENGRQWNGRKPYLFCNSNWLERKEMTDDAFDANGNVLYTDPQRTQPLKIRDVAKRDYGTVSISFWWTSVFNAYVVVKSQAKNHYCNRNKKNKGVTTEAGDGIPYPSITVCPNGFEPRGRRRHAAQVNPVPRNSVGTNTQSIDQVYPVAMTLIHELFHLVLGNQNTFVDPATQSEEYLVAGMLGLGADKALRNPESMALVAVAYDITGNLYVGGQDATEFHLGYATKG